MMALPDFVRVQVDPRRSPAMAARRRAFNYGEARAKREAIAAANREWARAEYARLMAQLQRVKQAQEVNPADWEARRAQLAAMKRGAQP